MKEAHNKMRLLLRKQAMSVTQLSDELGVSKRYVGLIIQAHRTHSLKSNYYIADYQRTSGTMIPLYRYGRGADCEKPVTKSNQQSCAEWYQRNRVALKLKRRAKKGKPASPWDGLLIGNRN